MRSLTFKTLKQRHDVTIIRSLYDINKYSQKNFRGTIEKRESVAQQIFPCLRYILGNFDEGKI